MRKQAENSQQQNQSPNGEKSPRGLRKQNRFLETCNSGQKQKLIEQNIHLKTQIFQLSQQLQHMMGNQENGKQNSRHKQIPQDQKIKNKLMELKKQQVEVLGLRTRINIVKKQLETIYSNRTLLEKEEKLKKLSKQLTQLEEEKKSLIKLKDNQNKVLKIIKTEEQLQERLNQLKNELGLLKQEAKNIANKHIETERVLRKNHESYIIKKKQLKQVEQRVNSLKGIIRGSKVQSSRQVTQRMVMELKEEVLSLEQQRKDNEKMWQDKISALDSSANEKKQQEEKKLGLLKEKQRQLRVIEFKIRQAEHARRRIATENLTTAPADVDMHHFRYRRNIKYIRPE